MNSTKIKVLDKSIFIQSKEEITPLVIECIEIAYMAILTEYNKLTYILNKENRILEAKYYAIEVLQSYEYNEFENKTIDLLCQYVINLEFNV